MIISVILLMISVTVLSCGSTGTTLYNATIEYNDGNVDPSILALRFAPRLYLHKDEPFKIVDIIAVLHPEKPIIAYHVFFEKEVLSLRNIEELDHEIVWVEFDPVTLKVADVQTLWHRTVLRTDTGLLNARASRQRPSVHVQWGQHGILPLGWETLTTARPRIELRIHYNLVKILSRVSFQGSYTEYLQFTEEIDAASYLENQEIIVAENPSGELRSRFELEFAIKKDWPAWSPR